MKILVHSCCGPCLGGTYPQIIEKQPEVEVAAYWDNPNIHPYIEYLSRLKAFKKVTEELNLKTIYGDYSYGLERFLSNLQGDFSESRCIKCYEQRLEPTALAAIENGFEYFSTTLLISPFQQHDNLKTAGQLVATKHGIPFYYQDLRVGFNKTHDAIKRFDLYKQKYCGCIFSEYDRYKNSKKHQIKLNPVN